VNMMVAVALTAQWEIYGLTWRHTRVCI
jgi:hypothetical protein